MDRFIKRIVEAVFHLAILKGHLPTSIPYLPYLCHAAMMPQQIIDIASEMLPASKPAKNGASAAPSDGAVTKPGKKEHDDTMTKPGKKEHDGADDDADDADDDADDAPVEGTKKVTKGKNIDK